MHASNDVTTWNATHSRASNGSSLTNGCRNGDGHGIELWNGNARHERLSKLPNDSSPFDAHITIPLLINPRDHRLAWDSGINWSSVVWNPWARAGTSHVIASCTALQPFFWRGSEREFNERSNRINGKSIASFRCWTFIKIQGSTAAATMYQLRSNTEDKQQSAAGWDIFPFRK